MDPSPGDKGVGGVGWGASLREPTVPLSTRMRRTLGRGDLALPKALCPHSFWCPTYVSSAGSEASESCVSRSPEPVPLKGESASCVCGSFS